MECAICQLRSSVGYCAECKALLCEVCNETCSHCGAVVCPECLVETSSGRELCKTCMAKYQKRKAHRAAEREAGPRE
jgi:hypothetical protein